MAHQEENARMLGPALRVSGTNATYRRDRLGPGWAICDDDGVPIGIELVPERVAVSPENTFGVAFSVKDEKGATLAMWLNADFNEALDCAVDCAISRGL